jgi:hypothetical protein
MRSKLPSLVVRALLFSLAACGAEQPAAQDPSASVTLSPSATSLTPAPAAPEPTTPPAPSATPTVEASAPPPSPAKCAAEPRNPRLHPPARVPAVSGPIDLDTRKWKIERASGMELELPKGLFASEVVPGGVRLWSELMVDAPHGLVNPGDESRHWFRAELRVLEKSLREAVCEATPQYFDTLFPPGTKTPDVPDKGSAEERKVDGRNAYAMQGGAHGYDEMHVFVDLGARRSAVLSFYVIGDYLNYKIPKRNAKVAEQQREIVESILASMKFTGG